ncbi:hypothetical protein ANTRET_LOCUS603 [Anthophora retusa]
MEDALPPPPHRNLMQPAANVGNYVRGTPRFSPRVYRATACLMATRTIFQATRSGSRVLVDPKVLMIDAEDIVRRKKHFPWFPGSHGTVQAARGSFHEATERRSSF